MAYKLQINFSTNAKKCNFRSTELYNYAAGIIIIIIPASGYKSFAM